MVSLRSIPLAALASALLAGAPAQAQGRSALPPTPPTSATMGTIAPLAAVGTPADRVGARHHRAVVNYTGGLLEVRADNSSLNGILRLVAQRTGMRIVGGVTDQRVYGNYGPAMPATVLATLLDGTGSNVLLKETAADQPTELILTPRTAGPTPPGPEQVADDDPVNTDETSTANANPAAAANAGRISLPDKGPIQPEAAYAAQGVSPTVAGPGVVSGPVSIPQPINNVLGSPNNSSPNAATYPTTNSVPLDSLPTPSTTPNQTGIVTAPNPPPAGSDTAALLNGRTTNQPGNITITPPASPNGAAPNGTDTIGAAANAGTLTLQQVVEQLQRLRQSQSNPQATPGTAPAQQPR